MKSSKLPKLMCQKKQFILKQITDVALSNITVNALEGFLRI